MRQPTPLDALQSELAAVGVFEPVTRYYVALGSALALVNVGAYTALLAMPGLAIRSISVLAAVFTSVQLALLAHDASHGAIARSRWSRQLVGHLGMSLVNGYRFSYFTATHLAHHAHPNDPARDPDMRPEVFSVHAPWPQARRGILRVVRRYQVWLLPCGLLLWTFALRGNGLIYALRHARAARADLAAIVLHGGIWLVAPASVLGPGAALVNYCVISALIGVYLGTLFIPNHVGMPTVSDGSVQSYLIRQTMTARNFGGSRFVAFLARGLDSQIEHHLLPHIPSLRLRQARGIVREFCARRDLPYRDTGYLNIWRDVLAHLHRVGRTAARPTRSAPPGA